MQIKGNSIQIGASIGIVIYPDDVGSGGSISAEDSLINKSDMALYKAKSTGRNRLYFYDSDLEVTYF